VVDNNLLCLPKIDEIKKVINRQNVSDRLAVVHHSCAAVVLAANRRITDFLFLEIFKPVTLLYYWHLYQRPFYDLYMVSSRLVDSFNEPLLPSSSPSFCPAYEAEGQSGKHATKRYG